MKTITPVLVAALFIPTIAFAQYGAGYAAIRQTGVAESITNGLVKSVVNGGTSGSTGIVSQVGGIATITFPSPSSKVCITNNQADVTLTFSNSYRSVAGGLFADAEHVTFGKMLDTFRDVAGASLFGATNAHPVLTGAGSLVDILPGVAWSIPYDLAAGTNQLGEWYYTNAVNTLIPAGTYMGHYYAGYSGVGGPDVHAYFALIASDGTTTNVLGISDLFDLATVMTATDSYIHIATNSFLPASWYLGVRLYGIRTGGVSATLTIYGGLTDRDSHLQAPALRPTETAWGSIGGTITDQTDLTNYVKGLPVSTFSNDVGNVTNNQQNVTLEGIFTRDGTNYALEGSFPTLRLLLGGIYTDFMLKASTGNFANAATTVYWLQSINTNSYGGDTNAYVYYTDDYSATPEAWKLATNSTPIFSQLVNQVYGEIESVIVSPSHDCAIPWQNWMSQTNTLLVWSYCRCDTNGEYEVNATGSQLHWNPVIPTEWRTRRITP